MTMQLSDSIAEDPSPRIAPVSATAFAHVADLGDFRGNAAQYVNQRPPLNILATLANYPDLLAAFLALNAQLLGDTLPDRDRELVILRTAWKTRAPYEWAHHAVIGAAVGLSEADIASVATGPEDSHWDTFDAALLSAVDQLHDVPTFISEATWKVLASRYNEQQLLALLTLAGLYTTIAYIVNSCRVQLDASLPSSKSLPVAEPVGTTAARSTRYVVYELGRAFMTAPELFDLERESGLPFFSLYFRGRSAVIGNPSTAVLAELFGVFAERAFAESYRAALELPAERAVQTYSQACWQWARTHLAQVPDIARTTKLVLRIVDAADASALPLFAGWRVAPRPDDDAAALVHAIMVLRELRGGLHFVALRANGLSVPEALAVNPEGGRTGLLVKGWNERQADELLTRASASGATERWRRAEELTNELFGQAISWGLDNDDSLITEFTDRLVALEQVPWPRSKS